MVGTYALSDEQNDFRAAVGIEQRECGIPECGRALEAEDLLPLAHRGLELGRQSHREWLEFAFAPQLEMLRGPEREARLLAVYAATDIYLWKLLRRDLKRSREETHDTVCRLVRGVLSART